MTSQEYINFKTYLSKTSFRYLVLRSTAGNKLLTKLLIGRESPGLPRKGKHLMGIPTTVTLHSVFFSFLLLEDDVLKVDDGKALKIHSNDYCVTRVSESVE